MHSDLISGNVDLRDQQGRKWSCNHAPVGLCEPASRARAHSACVQDWPERCRRLSFFLYAGIGLASCVALGYVLSLVLFTRGRSACVRVSAALNVRVTREGFEL